MNPNSNIGISYYKIYLFLLLIGRFLQKKSLFLLILGFLLSPKAFSQSLEFQSNFKVEEASLQQIFNYLEEEIPFTFTYRVELISTLESKISRDIENISLFNLLQDLSNQYGLWFWQMNNTISINNQNEWQNKTDGVLICPNRCKESLTQEQNIRFTIEGKIVDSSTNEPIFGATLLLRGTSIGTSTALDGSFVLKRIPFGNNTFLVRYLGYKTEELNFFVDKSSRTNLMIELEPDVFEGDEVMVYSQALGQAKAIRDQISSTSLKNVVSESKIRELPDANAAESVGRLPGVSVIRDSGEGQRIAIRGLEPRHNSITLDGDRIPSSDGDGRAVDLNMISPEMLSGIEVFKAILPDMDADAIGGSVNFKFAGVPEKKSARFNFGNGYSNHNGNFGTYNAAFNGSGRFFDNKLGVLASVNAERNDRSSENFNASYKVLRDPREGELYAPMGVNNINLSDRLITRDRYGLGLIMDYEIPNGKIMMNNFLNKLNNESINYGRSFTLSTFTQNYRLSETRTETDILSSRLSGEHEVFGSLFEWRVARNISYQNKPYDHRVGFEELAAFFAGQVDESRGPEFIESAAVNDIDDTHFAGSNFEINENLERDFLAQADLSIPIFIGEQLSGKLKFGGKSIAKNRSREGREWRIRSGDGARIYQNEDRDWIFTPNGRLSIQNFLDPSFAPGSILRSQYSIPYGINRSEIQSLWRTHEQNHIERLLIQFDDQEAVERVNSAYVMSEMNLGSKLTLLPGIRYEYTNSDYTAKRGQLTGNYRNQGNIVDTTATQKFGMHFPMVHLRYNISTWLDLRAAYTETISRPNFTELLPREEVSANSRNVRRGSPNLEPASATNYDLFLTAYGNKIGLFSIGGFYKEIDNLIYNRKAVVLDPIGLGLEPQTRGYDLFEAINNPNLTTVNGFEIEWQSNLTYLRSPFNGLVINVNYARIWSETQYPQFFLERTAQGIVGVDTFRNGPMVNQPDYVVNVSMGYDFKSFSSRVSAVFQGKTLNGIGERIETDSFTEAFTRWDAALKYKLTNNFNLYLNLQNLTNEPDLATQFTERFSTFQEYYNWTVEAGIRITL